MALTFTFASRCWRVLLLCLLLGNCIATPSTAVHDFGDNVENLVEKHGQIGAQGQHEVNHHHNDHAHVQNHLRRQSHQQLLLTPRTAPVQLRILCLGSSIVGGNISTDHNGFRYALRSALVADGHHVNMIGSLNIGSMGDNQVEGWGGYRIDQVAEKANLSLPSLPNVVCILAGGNDVYQNRVDGMSHRMAALIDQCLAASPGVTVLVSTLPPNDNSGSPTWESSMEIFNANLTQEVNSRAHAGQKVFLVDCHSSWWSVADMPRNNHPSDAGYIKMARVFYDGIVRAKSVITAPNTPAGGIDDSSPPDLINGNKCDKNAKNEKGPIRTGLETGSNDGGYVAAQNLYATVFSMTTLGGGGTSAALHWADVRLDDYISIPNMTTMTVALSLGAGKFGSAFTVDISNMGWPCVTTNIRFADIGGDGRSDMCCVSDAGAISCATNSYVEGATWKFSSQTTIAAVLTGYTGSRNRLADIDGDGRADRLVIKVNGDIDAWRNAGTGDYVDSWQPLGTVSANKTFSDVDGIQLIDINGDARADLLWMDDYGKVKTWINNRGFSTNSLAATWTSAGITHPGTTVAGTRALTSFGKIFGTSYTVNNAIWGQIKTDMVLTNDTPRKSATFRIYENVGINGVRLRGDGVRFCDMRNTGSADYLWVSQEGTVTMYGNVKTPPTWKGYGNIFAANRNRRDIHIADLDGDGKCDILIVDKATGSTSMYRNDYNAATDEFVFKSLGVISGTATCTGGYGPGLTDHALHFADLSGDGKADYLCLSRDGSTTAFLNSGLNAFAPGVLVRATKAGAGVDRADVRFADVNGDGKADYVVVDKFSGAYNVSVNAWDNRTAATKFSWLEKGFVSPGGRARGSAVLLANLNGTGRADYVIVDPATAIQDTWFNFCPNAHGLLGPPPLPLPIDPSNPQSGKSTS